MDDGLLDLTTNNSKQARQYTSPPNTSFGTGLLNLLSFLGIDHEQKHAQPYFFGQDSVASGGRSPNYPEFRTYNDAAEYNYPAPTIADYTAYDGAFDEEGYDKAMMEYHRARSEHPEGGNW